jgi:Na+-transporting methylmalonyl-CoA/oxaloacetate decarboxylase beta subunit
MSGIAFLRPETILVFILGMVAFSLGTVAGVLLSKLMYVLSGKNVNPMIGACGISAFPMSSRVVQKLGLEANPHNHLLMHGVGANTAGQIASVVAGGVMLMLVPMFSRGHVIYRCKKIGTIYL